MPRVKGLNGLPIHRRKGYWICYVKLPDGTRRERALHLRDDGSRDSERAAVAAYWQEQARATAGTAAPRRARKALGDAIDALRAEQELAELTEHSLDNTVSRGAKLLDHFGDSFDMHTLTTEAMVGYAAEALKARAAITVRMELDVLCQAAKAVGLTPPRKPKLRAVPKPQEPLTIEQCKLFLLALHPRQRLLGLTLLSLGCRASEVAKIDDSSVDWEAKSLRLRGTKTRRSDRTLPIPEELHAYMLELKNAGKWRGFPKQSRQAIDQVVRAACKRAGIGPRSVNDLRGTWATLAALKGIGPDVRGAFQGNGPATQARYYSQPALLVEELRSAVASAPRITPPRPSVKCPSGNADSGDDLAPPTPIGSAKSQRKTASEPG
jgi:integrase